MKSKFLFLILMSVFLVLLPTATFALRAYNMNNSSYLVCRKGNLPLVSEIVKVNVKNQVAITTVEMIFDNPYNLTVQPNLRFPINEKAAVQKFSLTDSEGKTYEGTIEEKEQAKTTFEAAKSEGMMPAMVVQKKPGVFETSIGAIGPKSTATVKIEFSEILSYDKGKISFSFPFSIRNWQTKALNQASINVNIEDQKEIVGIKSNDYDIYANKKDKNNWTCNFEKNNFLPTKDFDLTYEVNASEMVANFLSTKPEKDKDGYFVLMLSPQESVKAEDIVARDIVFIMDVSGSMSGKKIRQTKAAFNFFVDKLNDNDRFSIVAFSNRVWEWKSELMPVTPDNIKNAKLFISNLHAGGGTNINEAMLQGLKIFNDNEKRTKAIVFLTDGEASTGVTSIYKITANYLTANEKDIRTFCLGVGSGVNKTLLAKLASENKGQCLYINGGDKLENQLISFYQSISTPLLVDLSVDWGNMKVSDCYPKTIPNIYKGTQLVITGRYSGSGEANISLNGKVNGKNIAFPITATFTDKISDNSFAGSYWARAKANELMKQINAGDKNPTLKNEVIRLSKKYQFATPYTSFIAVSTEQVPQINAQNSIKQNHNSAMVPTTSHAPGTRKVIMRKTKAKSFSLWGAGGFLPIAAVMIPNFRKARQQAREKACYANMRVLLGAVEMYNMDHQRAMKTLDIGSLVNEKYLRRVPEYPEETCRYGQIGDLDNSGCICCAEHGTVEDISQLPLGNATFNGQAVVVKNYTPWQTQVWNNYLLPFLNIAINIPILLLGLYFTYWVILLPFRVLKELLILMGLVKSNDG